MRERWPSRRLRSWRGTLPALLAVALLPLSFGEPARCQGRRQPEPPAPRPTLYDPDRSTCDPQRIRSAFQHQLQPYADQSAAVLAQLRLVQLDMVGRTLKRCVGRELLTAEQAAQLNLELTHAPIRP